MTTRWSIEDGMAVRRFGDGPELVWIHGLGEWSVGFDEVARHAELAGYQHVLVDLPGCGRSPWPEVVETGAAPGAGLVALADRLAAWIAATCQQPALIGHSMGGVLATLVAERAGVRAVVNVEGNLSRGDCTFSARGASHTLDDFVAHGFARMRGDVYGDGRDEPALRGYHGALCVASPRVFHQNAVDLVALSESGELVHRLAGLRVPVLYIAGVPDGSCCAHSLELLRQHGLRLLEIEPAGHWVFIDQPSAFVAAVAGFLRAS